MNRFKNVKFCSLKKDDLYSLQPSFIRLLLKDVQVLVLYTFPHQNIKKGLYKSITNVFKAKYLKKINKYFLSKIIF